ncbi:MAG: YbaB/EbfC family nucleoid-associated protein [Thermodesulfobacteriota bacterium]|nr:YbaB/EbfC family nucleoid-associated protein [Thermodesulfobacteriota bacterium]
MAKGMGNMLKQAQKLQSKIFKLQEEMADKTVETTVGGGMIRAEANGKQELTSIKIDPEVVDPNDVAMLEDLILAAVNDALHKAKDMVSQEMNKLAGGLNLPPGLM